MVDAVLLEWEEVLANTAGARRVALLRALADEGASIDSAAYERHCEGRPVHRAAIAALTHLGRHDDTLADLVVLRARRAFAEQIGKGFVLLPGAREFVQQAQIQSRVAVVTSATRSETEFVLRLAGFDDAISTIVASGDEVVDLPDADTFERALAQLGRRRALRRDRVIAIAPTALALRAARATGVRTIALGAPAHVSADADGAVDSLEGVALTELAQLAGIAMVEHQR